MSTQRSTEQRSPTSAERDEFIERWERFNRDWKLNNGGQSIRRVFRLEDSDADEEPEYFDTPPASPDPEPNELVELAGSIDNNEVLKKWLEEFGDDLRRYPKFEGQEPTPEQYYFMIGYVEEVLPEEVDENEPPRKKKFMKL